MEIRVIRAGMLTTVQDLGRRGHLAEGVPCGGAADPFALRVANLLVGNHEGEAALEITLTGPELEFSEAAWVAVCGARFDGLAPWKPLLIGPGGRLRFGGRIEGCRAYLSISGGIDVEAVLGGRGTFVAGGFGGFHGRALREGDVLRTKPSARQPTGHWGIDERILPRYSREPTVRVVPGAHAREFGGTLYSGRFTVTANSDRMGVRLDGPRLARPAGGELESSAVGPGTVQVPPDGNPIVLMADAQTIGGYPRVAHAASIDMPLLAQLAPGDGVRFSETSVAEAHVLARVQERRLGVLRQGLAEKLRPA
ncbi:MAG TPA: biotin-dependent carboxyltransferase family protein [Opitutaceae bacterium]|nr:biotin-dependent carboxyltransferase family protein [Opitutaceae bacterium]